MELFIDSLLKRHNLPGLDPTVKPDGSLHFQTTHFHVLSHAESVDVSRRQDFNTILGRMRFNSVVDVTDLSTSEALDLEKVDHGVSQIVEKWFGPVTAQGLEERSADSEEVGEAICTLMLSGLLVDDCDWRKAFENRKPGEFPSVRLELTPEIRDERAEWCAKQFGGETAWRNQRLGQAASEIVGSMTDEHLQDELISQLAPEAEEVEA